MNGIVANDRKLGFYRFLFAKPVAPPALLRAGVRRSLGGLRRRDDAARTASTAFPDRRCCRATLIIVIALMFLCYAGIAFLLSAAARWDWLSLVAVSVASTFCGASSARRRNPLAKLLYLLPPLHRATRSMRGDRRAGVRRGALLVLPWAPDRVARRLRRRPASSLASSFCATGASPSSNLDRMTVSDLSVALDPATVRRTTLANGLRVLVRRDRSAPVVAIVTYVSAGYFDETDDVVGIAHVLEHMYFKGTPTRGVGEIARQTKAVGGYLNAATIYDHTSYYTVLPASASRAGLDVQVDAYANSLIDAEELARELEVIIQEAKRKSDNPGAVATETLFELLHDRHRIRRWRIGREPGLRALTRDAMMRFYRNFYHPGNTVLVVVGDVDPDEALREIDGALRRAPGRRRRRESRSHRRGHRRLPLPRVDGRHRADADRVRLAHSADARRRPRRRSTSSAWCSARGAPRACTAPCASGSSRRRCPRTTTRRRRSACSSCTPRRRRSARRRRRARSGRRCATCARTA